jgi:hypothetical protein
MSSDSDHYSDKPCQQRTRNGDPCTSRALRDKRFCYQHEKAGPPPIDIHNNERNPARHVYLPRLEDAASIQAAISEVCELMLHKRIDPAEASALFYAMQVASINAAHMNAARAQAGTRNHKKNHDPIQDNQTHDNQTEANQTDANRTEANQTEANWTEAKQTDDKKIGAELSPSVEPPEKATPEKNVTAADNLSTPSSDPEEPLPPGTIQACAQPRPMARERNAGRNTMAATAEAQRKRPQAKCTGPSLHSG